MNKVLLPLVFSVITLSLIGSQQAFADTNIFNESSCVQSPVSGDFQSGTCVLDDTHTIPLFDIWTFEIDSKVTGTLNVNGAVRFQGSSSNSGTINVIGQSELYTGGFFEFNSGTDYVNECDGIINLMGSTVDNSARMLILGSNGNDPTVFDNFGTITGTNSDPVKLIATIVVIESHGAPIFATLNNHGTITAPVDTVYSNGIFNDNLPNQCGVIIGGEIIPIDQTALLLAGVQSISMWMIPVVISGAGIGVFVIMRIRK